MSRPRPLDALVCVVFIAAGCGEPPPEGKQLGLAGLYSRRAAIDKEWRDARRLPATDKVVLDAGAIPENGLLRLGILPLSAEPEARVRVFAGDDHVETFSVKQGFKWQDIRLDLPVVRSDATCRIEFSGLGASWLSPCEIVSPRSGNQPNVLVFLVDTLRMDHLGCYGYDRNTSPNFDALSQNGIRFTNLVPQSSWTRPSVASLLTSTYPDVHGANDWPTKMRDGMPSIAKGFEAAGYETHALMSNPQVLPTWGLGIDFMRCVDIDSSLTRQAEDKDVVERAIETARWADGRPWFMYVHTLGPHKPYVPPEPYRTRFLSASSEGSDEAAARRRAIDLYDGEIAFTDAQFGKLVGALKELGVYDDTIIVVVSDHGEGFWEHGMELHGNSLYEELLDVPLIVKLPKNAHAGIVRDGLVEMVDIGPTLLDLVGETPASRFQGVSFANYFDSPASEDRIGYASLFYGDHALRAAKTVNHKFVRDVVKARVEWFDLVRDPVEMSPVVTELDPRLPSHVARHASRGAQGFHLLITTGDSDHHTIKGTVSTDGLKEFEFDYYESKTQLDSHGDTLQFEILTFDSMDEQKGRDTWHTEFAEQNHAHLTFPVALDTPVRIALMLDGKPIPDDLIFVGADGVHRQLTNATLIPEKILAAPDAYNAAALPRRLAFYAWYVPMVTQLTEEQIDPATLEALKSLGYVE